MTILLKATIALLLALIVAALAKRASAATRHSILAAAQLAALTMPLLTMVVPKVTWVEPRMERVLTAAPAAAAVPARGESTPAPAPPARTSRILYLWLAGFAFVAVTRGRALVRASRIARRATPWRGVYLSSEVDQPVTLFRRILLPLDAPNWDASQLATVLLHERAHVTRHDSLLGLIGDATCAVYWFHPLAWIVARSAQLERERACDEIVLAHGVRGVDYATALLAVAQSAGRAAHGIPMAARSQIETRIRSILAGAARLPRRGIRALVTIAAIVAAPLLAALTPVSILRPAAGEPDLLGDAITSPYSEWIGAPDVYVDATGPDAALIAALQRAAAAAPESDIDLVPDRARWALGRVRDGHLVLPLLAALNDPDWRVRAYAAWALGEARDTRATAPLAGLLSDPIWRMRAMAAHALAQIADPAARPAMERALSDRAWQVRLAAVRYFDSVGDRTLVDAMRGDRHIAVRSAAGGDR